MSYGEFGVAASALQLAVPSYGLRLVRRFGTSRVGWFVFTSFIALMALHLLEPMGPARPGFGPELMLDCVYAVGSVLLLIGMGHIETLFKHADRFNSTHQTLNTEWEVTLQNQTANLVRQNQALQEEIARYVQSDTALRQSEAEYRFAFVENPQPMWMLDLRQCRFLAVNKAALRLYGFAPEEFMRVAPQDLLPPEQVEAFKKDLAASYSRAEIKTQWKHYRHDQALIDVEVAARDFTFAGSPARLMVMTNLTDQRRREHDACQADKMALIGRMAGGMAHHFNDVLASIENHVESLRKKKIEADSIELLQEISLETARGSHLTSKMLAASGLQFAEPRPLDLNRLITNLNLILRRIGGERITFQNQCSLNPMPVMADPQIIEQVLMALVENAADAVPESGTVSVSTAMARVECPPIQSGEQAFGFVRISVRDNGCGMSPEVQARLFEPFFTTKEPDKGIGLDLPAVFGAVRQMGGWMECVSDEGTGTEFRIFLPCIDEKLLPSVSDAQATTSTYECGTVLVVDANDRSRGVARYHLNRSGYRVVEADSAAIALMLWDGQARQVDLLLTDIDLPGGSGFDLANQLQQRRPDLKVVYTYSGTGDGDAPPLPEGSSAVSKPYRSDRLIETVEACLPKPQAGKKRSGRA